MNEKLKILFDEDQHDCLHQPPSNGSSEYKLFRERFRQRNIKAKSIIETSEQLEGVDFFHACIMFIHGDCPDDFLQAYNYGLKSIELNHINAKKFTAAAYDKWLMYQGKPQKYGLQFVPDGVRLRLWDVDPETTDHEREKWDVSPLRKLYEMAEEATKKYDMSTFSLETKPQWLRDAIKRWNNK
ncbi:hypothetical protein E1171_01090 [Cytophagales bacterium RKSG123]|nr:hypothetical protein [Xanthovirga aplysinae]